MSIIVDAYDKRRSVLALDLGTTTGFCVGTAENHLSGTWDLKPSRFDGGGMRFVKFRQKLDELYAACPFGVAYYEEVRRHRGTDAAHIYGGLWATFTAWCEEHQVAYAGVGVGEIKRAATGKGNADKQQMIDAVRARGYRPATDDEADAVALFLHKVGCK